MVILTQYHTEIQNRGISTIGASEIFPVSRMPRFQRLHCIIIKPQITLNLLLFTSAGLIVALRILRLSYYKLYLWN